MLRKVLFQVHLWTGLVLGLVLALLGLSGSFLVYDHELMSLWDKPVPHAVLQGAPLPLDALIAAAREAPTGKRAQITLLPPQKPGDAAVVRLQSGGREPGARPGGKHERKRERMQGRPGAQQAPQAATEIYLDPVSGKVLEIRKAAANPLIRFIHDFHGNFLMGRDGRSIVGWFGVAMVLLGLSGIVLWWPKRGTWKFAFGVRKGARGYLFHRDLHGAAGIWLWVVFIIVSFSGVVIAFPDTSRMASGAAAMSFDPRRGPEVEPADGVKPLGADGAVALVKAQMPNAVITSIAMPGRKNEAIRIMTGALQNGPVSLAYIDPYQKKIAAWRNPPAAAQGERFVAWQRPLHSGDGWGPVWRALVFVSGFLPLLFVITGTVMWLKKRKGKRASLRAV